MVTEMINMNERNKIPILITIVVIILIMFIGFTSQQREQIFFIEKWMGNTFLPAQLVISRTLSRTEDGLVTLLNSGSIKSENEELKEQIIELQNQLIEQQLSGEEREELKSLQQTLNNIAYPQDFNPVSAYIIGKNPGNWFDMFTINAGSKHGVHKNSVVIGSGGLVGRVYETGTYWAKVISIIDNSSSVSFQIMRDGTQQGILSGSVTHELSGYLFDPDADVVVGDKLITSGIGLYPRGILIGEVTAVDKTIDMLLKSVIVEPAVDFNRINKVLVISPRTIDE
jgi:rod shape-determining protein MreC